MATKWCTKLEVAWKRCPVVFQGHTTSCKVTRLKKSSILTQNGRFRTVTPAWIHRWLWNVAQSLKQQRRDALLFSKVIHQISRSHGTKHHRFWWAFPDYRSVAAFKSLRFALFKVIRQISRSHGSKNCRIWPRLGVSGLYLQFEFTNGYEMLHKAWSSIEEVPYCFPRSSIKFQGHTE